MSNTDLKGLSANKANEKIKENIKQRMKSFMSDR